MISLLLKKNGVFKNDPKETIEVFNNYHINVVETTSGKRLSSIRNSNSQSQDRATVKKIIESHKNYPCEEKVLPCSLSFDLPPASNEDINKIVKSLNANKATGPHRKPLKLIKLSTNVVDKYLTIIINHDISRSLFSNWAKNALVRPIYEKKDRQNKENYRPVSMMRGINDSMIHAIQTFISNFVSAYGKNSNHVLISLIENWKNNLDNKTVGAVFIDLSKAFDFIPYDLLIAKMEAYGFSEDFLTFLYSYLKRQKQSVNINNVHSMIQILLSGVSQGPF